MVRALLANSGSSGVVRLRGLGDVRIIILGRWAPSVLAVSRFSVIVSSFLRPASVSVRWHCVHGSLRCD